MKVVAEASWLQSSLKSKDWQLNISGGDKNTASFFPNMENCSKAQNRKEKRALGSQEVRKRGLELRRDSYEMRLD